jgi:lipopolysaccharide biosynthesis regulator YciM
MKIKRTVGLFGLAIVALALSRPAFAQEGKGIGRLGGLVINLEGQAIVGAKVTLVFSKNENVKLETTTNKKGEWSFIGLGTGYWSLAITAKGYVPEKKTLNISQLSVNPKVTVKLQKRGLGEGTGVIEDEASFELLETGNRLLNEQKYDDALAAYQQFLEKNPLAYQINISIGDCYRGKGEYDKAIEIYNQVIEQAKTDPTLGKEMTAKALAGIGNCYIKQDKIEEAQKLFEQSIESSPDDEILAYNVGEIYFSHQKYDQAIRYFELAAKIKPDWPDSYLKLGYVYLNKAETASAIPQFEKFLTLEPDTERSALVKNILNAIKK